MNFTRPNPEQNPRCIKDGDLVILYERYDSLQHTWIQKGGETQNRFGVFRHDDIIGKPFGYKATAANTNCWQYVLEPTPELWSHAFKTRTQIVNEMDQSIVTTMLNIKPGDVVVESGTGSGCMTLSLMRAVYHPDKESRGHVNTFEYNSFRAEEAKKEFEGMNVDGVVTVRCQDVCIPGPASSPDGEVPGFPGVAPGTVDAVFLDVPEPYKAVHYAKALLKPNKKICCYSPCISQVIDTCARLRELGFTGVQMLEFRQRAADSRTVALENIDLRESDENTAHKSDNSAEGAEAAEAAEASLSHKRQATEQAEQPVGGAGDSAAAVSSATKTHIPNGKKKKAKHANANSKLPTEFKVFVQCQPTHSSCPFTFTRTRTLTLTLTQTANSSSTLSCASDDLLFTDIDISLP
eukprot:GSChrysophyteH1.ASY1.ANO1.253.1 assembled CDS